MSKGSIISQVFNSEAFPLSVHCENYHLSDRGNELVIQAIRSEAAPDLYTYIYSEDEKAFYKDCPNENYTIVTTLDDDIRESPEIVFSLKNDRTGDCDVEYRLDYAAYLDDYQTHYLIAIESGYIRIGEMNSEFEMEFSTNYIKERVGKIIEGTDEFWHRFTGNLDNATLALSYQTHMAKGEIEDKPIRVVNKPLNGYTINN